MIDYHVLSELTALSPVDGRYAEKTLPLRAYFSEAALIKYRLHVEVEYFIALTKILPELESFCDHRVCDMLRKKVADFSIEDAWAVKMYEQTTNHDVKAVEYFLRDCFGDYPEQEFIHFALTSFDTDGIARPLMLKDAHEKIVLPVLEVLVSRLRSLSNEWKDIPMLARTHGQAASPTTLGKEIYVFVDRLNAQITYLDQVSHTAKLGGATGNFNAHHVAYPEIDWPQFADRFVADMGLVRTAITTQIEPYDNVAAYCHAWMRINTIIIDFCRDIWMYIMLEQLSQKVKAGETGSSTMPHKVNPLDFENAEGNMGFANALLDHLAQKLPISRLQRDLTDSTVIRNMGMPLAYMLISFQSLQKGLGKLIPNVAQMEADLEDNWAVASEAYQTVLRREKYPKPYEALKDLTRKGEKITKETLHAFVNTLKVSDAIKAELKAITPLNYIGVRLY